LNIDIIVNDGSPIGVTLDDLYGRAGRVGIGGAELALLTMCEQWGNEGHNVRLYNDPHVAVTNWPFEQLPRAVFHKREDTRDVLIIFRSPNPMSYGASGYKVWWSCDQQTVGNFGQFSEAVDRTVVISPFHKTYFELTYGIRSSVVIDLPVRLDDYVTTVAPRVPTRALFASVPDRGLPYLHQVWSQIRQAVPEAELIITSDYQLWGSHAGNESHRVRFIRTPGVSFLGAVLRETLVQYQLTSGVLAYPCTYDELFCITCAESLVAGCLPISTDCGALATTNMYKPISGSPLSPGWSGLFADAVIEDMLHPDEEKRTAMQLAARARFDPKRISEQWKEKVFPK
jgi:glycosyltransferase involved in cell wall biosynthesis